MDKKIKILFVSSGNSDVFQIAPFILAQGESLKKFGVILEYFNIKGKGLLGYLQNIKSLRSLIKANNFNLIHAHYGLSCWVAMLTLSKLPLVVSLMGDDAYGEFNKRGKINPFSIYLIVLSKLLQPFVKHIIVKSENIRKTVLFKYKCSVIPNGVNLKQFELVDKSIAKSVLKITGDAKILLFLGNPNDNRKNLDLLREAAKLVTETKIKIVTPYPVTHKEVQLYLNASDVFILTSFNEGSPNVIKEAMACNCPIVSTDVGDVRWVFGETEGCYLTSFEIEDTSQKIKKALEFAEKTGSTKGRERIFELGLDSETIAKRIIAIYEKVLSE